MLEDPWGFLGKEFPSKCCPGKKATAVMYDHTGAIVVKCACGAEYAHNEGAYRRRPEFDNPETERLFAEEGG